MDGVWQIFVALAAAMAMCPFAFFWGCLPCCQGGCDIDDDKPRTNPKNEGTWVPSGTWLGAGGVTWTFQANPGNESGETWFFFGSDNTSKSGGEASLEEQRDWDNLCNWYSNKTTSPDQDLGDDFDAGSTSDLNKRATRLPPEDAIVHVYTPLATAAPKTVKAIYFWGFNTNEVSVPGVADTPAIMLLSGSEITATGTAHDSAGGAVLDMADMRGTINGGATFNPDSYNVGTVNDGAIFNGREYQEYSPIDCENRGTVNGGATFNGLARNDTYATVNGGAVFNNHWGNGGTVNGGATFNNESSNAGTVNGGATFNDNSSNFFTGTVNDGATFNDAACSLRTIGSFDATPCSRQFVAHPTDSPTCNGTAPDGCQDELDSCGCG